MSAPSRDTTLDAHQLRLAERVARLYYVHDRSKVEVAAELGVSRFKVARLLQFARSNGIVHITINDPVGGDGELALELRGRYGLRDVVVVPSDEATGVESDTALRQRLGVATAGVLTGVVTKNDVLGLGWARTVIATAANLGGLAACPVVQLSGALARPDVESDAIGLTRRVAAMNGGPASFFYAPMVTDTVAAARAIRAQSYVAAARARYDQVTVAVVGVGSWQPTPASTLVEALTPAERAAARRDGVYADLSGVLLDHEGRALATRLSRRIIGIDAAQLHAVPNVVGVAYGTDKAVAAHAALVGGYIDTLVTDSLLARELLGTNRD